MDRDVRRMPGDVLLRVGTVNREALMIRWVLFVVILGAVVGYLVHLAWGVTVGTAVAVAVAVLGLVAITLRRNQRDLKELEQQHEPEAVEEGAHRRTED